MDRYEDRTVMQVARVIVRRMIQFTIVIVKILQSMVLNIWDLIGDIWLCESVQWNGSHRKVGSNLIQDQGIWVEIDFTSNYGHDILDIDL